MGVSPRQALSLNDVKNPLKVWINELTYSGAPSGFSGVIGVVVGCSAPANQQPAASFQPAQPVTQPAPSLQGPPVSINAEMVSFVDHAGHALWDVEREGKAPKTDADWALVEDHATQLAAAGSLLMLPGTGVNDKMLTDQPDWQKWTRTLSDAGIELLRPHRLLVWTERPA